jgi:two-component system nitrate/nitrite response regulator NarL
MPDPPAPRISVLVLDDHALFREGVTRLLSAEEDLDVSHCGSIDEALALVGSRPIDVVLLDLDLGSRRGAEFLPLAREAGFPGRVLVVAAAIERTDAAALIRQGVSGILTKHESVSKLADGIRDVAAGKLYFDEHLLREAMEHAGEATGQHRVVAFTVRERTVLRHVFEGLTNKEIADRVGVSESGIKATLQQLFGKTGVRTRSQLVRIVLERHRNDV